MWRRASRGDARRHVPRTPSWCVRKEDLMGVRKEDHMGVRKNAKYTKYINIQYICICIYIYVYIYRHHVRIEQDVRLQRYIIATWPYVAARISWRCAAMFPAHLLGVRKEDLTVFAKKIITEYTNLQSI